MDEQGQWPMAMENEYAALPLHEPVPLYTGPMTIKTYAARLAGKGRLLLAFVPSPHIRFEVDVAENEGGMPLGRATIELPSLGCSARASITNRRMTSHREDVEGIVDERLVAGAGGPARNVRFNVLNFADFMGTGIGNRADMHTGLHVWAGRAELRFGPWAAVLDAPPDGSERWRQAECVRGYAITHVGDLRRGDGAQFSLEDAAKAFEFLHWALSFANGARCDCVLRKGFTDSGNPVWEDWCVGQVAPAVPRSRWITDRPLGSAFDFVAGFYDLWRDPNNHEWLRLAIGLYVAGNCETTREIRLITGQVTLELLVSAVLEEPGVKLPNDAHERIRKLLRMCSMPLCVPLGLPDVGTVPLPRGMMDDGPTRVTYIRNRLVHPKQSHRRTLSALVGNPVYEAAELTLWYVEMVLLHQFGYRGYHCNRTKNPQWAGAKELVPWA